MDNSLQDFVRKIINLDATPPGTNISYAGLIGASNPRLQSLEDLKGTSLKLAQEYGKKNPDNDKIKELAKEVEGGLHGLNSLSVIDDNTLDKLLADLDALKINEKD
jgi:hypothetical protein